ncbi:MAG: hypothetical protein J5997_05860 [Oscillospiraceae bacterium]|nr:hypothetical protein [Oscillospiraceae bacterium]
MRIIVTIIFTAILLTACGGGDTETETVTHSAATMTGEGVLIEETENIETESISETQDISE